MDHYAVFGYPIQHSKSPIIHQQFAHQTAQTIDYQAFAVPAEQFSSALDNFIAQGGKGLNCTVPLKELAFLQAHHLSDRARMSKAVNTLSIDVSGKLRGDNTDGIGLVKDLQDNQQTPLQHSAILILGAGGATRGIIGPILEQNPAKLVVANRTVEKAITLEHEFNHPILGGCGFNDLHGLHFDLIINATSASLSNELPPLPADLLAANGSCYDLAYANQATPFVRWGQQQNAAKSIDGLGMLVEQAAEAFYIWRGMRPDTQPVIQALNNARDV